MEFDGFSDIREAMLENAPLAAAAADDEGEGVECTIVEGNCEGTAGDDRPLLGGDSEGTGGVG